MKKIFILIISTILFSASITYSAILEKDYVSIFSKYEINNRDVAQNIINKCVNKFGKNNIKVTTNNKGEKVLEHQKEKEFLNCTYDNILQKIKPIPAVNSLQSTQIEEFILNNELTFDDGTGNGKVTYVFNNTGYEKFKNGKKIGSDGWRFSKLKTLRVFMDGEKTTWRISKNFLALSIKKGNNKAVPYFLEYENKDDAKKRRKRLADKKQKEEKRKKEERLAEEKRKEEERLAEEKRKEEERLAEERRKQEEERKKAALEKKLALLKTSELEQSQNLIKDIKSFIQTNPNVFEIVELAKYMIKVETILDGSYTEQNKKDLAELKNFVYASPKFKKYHENILKIEENKKLTIIDKEIKKLENTVKDAKDYLQKNFDSPYASQLIEIIEFSENTLQNIDSLENVKNSYNNIKKLGIEINEYQENYQSLETELNKLKVYLAQYISTEISESIIVQIELIEKILKDNEPDKIKLAISELDKFYEDVISSYQTKLADEQERLAEEKRKEEERLAEEKRKEEERLAEEKRKEEERLAEEKRKEEERLAEERRKEEEIKLQDTFKKYNANNQFQKDLIRILTKTPGMDLRNIKFSRGDRLIQLDFSINNNQNSYNFNNLNLKNINKKVFNKLISGIETGEFDFSVFQERKWFDEISSEKVSIKTKNVNFDSSILFKNLEFKDYVNNLNLIKKVSANFNLKEDEIKLIGSLLSLSLRDITFKDFFSSFKNNNNFRKVSIGSLNINQVSLLNWGKWTFRNVVDQDSVTNTEVVYEYSDFSDIIFDKSEIIKASQNYGSQTFTINENYKIFFNMISSLGKGTTKNITVKELSSKRKIASANNINLNSLKFDYINQNRDQKFITEVDFSLNGIDLSITDISPEFSNYFKLMGYDNVKFDFGTLLKWVPNQNILNFNFDIGITDAVELDFKSTFSGLSADAFNINNQAAIGAYLLSNFKLNELTLSLIDNSLKDNLIKLAAAQTNVTTNEFKKEIINQINTYTASASQTNLFNQYKNSVVKFINGAKKIVIQISPNTPISVAEASPYFLAMDYDQIIKVLNLSIKN